MEFFSNSACDPSGNGEGRVFLGSTSLTPNASGNASFSTALPVAVATGDVVTATATDPDGNTSEFSPCRLSGAPTQFSLDVTKGGSGGGIVTASPLGVAGAGVIGAGARPAPPARSRPTAPSPAGAPTATGRRRPPAGTFTAVSAGDRHTCAIKTDGTLACWGNNYDGQATAARRAPSPPSAPATSHLRDQDRRHPRLLGRQRRRPDDRRPRGTFTAVSAGSFHTCAIKTDGTLACWGDNSDGQTHAPGGTFTAVSAGAYHTCAIKTDGTLACWGSTSTASAPPRRAPSPRQRRQRPHLRDQDRRHPRLLGLQRRRPGERPRGTFTSVSAGGSTPARSGPTGPSSAGAPTPTAGRTPPPVPSPRGVRPAGSTNPAPRSP